ncbi:crotonase/enoyl-CoA hydratase family protein [Shewanella sp.]|uniref:crotonase/enoyl-CoA hydratase family protein n=1 Tax=Shewanella sp. TaxID=50422 RepID=UPI00405455BA
MDGGLVTLEKNQGIAYVTLSRPDKYNALNFDMFKAIDKVIKQLQQDKQLRLVILSGAGGNFSSGLDVKSLNKDPSKALNLLFKWLPGNANLAQRVSLGWQRLPVPVIAVIEGICYGGGMQIVLGADIRIASDNAKLSIMEAKWGLVPDMAGLAGLRQLIGKDQALKLTYTAEVIDAEKAFAIGLVTEVSLEPMARAKALAEQIMQTSPDACAAIKLSINRSWTGSLRSLLSRESVSQVRLLLGKNRLIAALRQTKDPQKPYKNRKSWW